MSKESDVEIMRAMRILLDTAIEKGIRFSVFKAAASQIELSAALDMVVEDDAAIAKLVRELRRRPGSIRLLRDQISASRGHSFACFIPRVKD